LKYRCGKILNGKHLTFSFIILIAFLLGGCAGFDREEMVIKNLNLTNSHPYSISVSIGNEGEKEGVGLMTLPKEDLLYAIEESIRNGRVFEQVVSGKEGEYRLNVTVFSLQQPTMGFNMTVKLEAGWTLKKAEGGIVWQELIKSSYSLGVGDAFAGATRLRMVNDGAIRENIKQGMIKLSALSL